MNRDQIINIFLEKCGEPTNIELLEQYVDFVFSSKQNNLCSEYCENHHILPSTQFKNTNLPVDSNSTVASSLNTKGWIFIQHNENWHRKNKQHGKTN